MAFCKELGKFKCEIAYFFSPTNVGVSILDVTGGGMYPHSQMYIFWSLLSLCCLQFVSYITEIFQVPNPIVGYLHTMEPNLNEIHDFLVTLALKSGDIVNKALPGTNATDSKKNSSCSCVRTR